MSPTEELQFNGTARFLFPAMLKVFGEGFRAKLAVMPPVAIGIADRFYESVLVRDKNVIFMCNYITEGNKLQYRDFVHYCRTHLEKYYIYNYNYRGEDSTPYKMMVFEFPQAHAEAYQKFIQGKYSEMYPDFFVETVIKSDFSQGDVYAILKRMDIAKSYYQKVMKDEYDVTIPLEEVGECLPPPKTEEEVFNAREHENIYLYSNG